MKAQPILIIVIALLILWLGITGKFDCFAGTLDCMTGKAGAGVGVGAGASASALAPRSNTLERVEAALGPVYHYPGFRELLSARTPPFAG